MAKNISARYRIDDGEKFKLADFDPRDTADIGSKDDARDRLAAGIERLTELQEKLYAQDRWAVLVVLQAMDAAGKDGTVEHVMSGVNPAGCQVTAFKEPSAEELDHTWLWRCSKAAPERGMIGIFNRSHYEETLVVRVHPEILKAQKLAPELVTKDVWKERFEDIRGFERHLARNGTKILKFFLNMSRAEQKERFLARIAEPEKNWKFAAGDVRERQHWDEYMAAYEDAIRETARPHAPWFVVPADKKWFTRLVVADAIVAALEELHPAYPTVDAARKAELGEARRTLESEK